MTLLHLHHDTANGLGHANPHLIEKLARKVGAGLRAIHRGIERARLRRTQWRSAPDDDEMFADEHDASRLPQSPMVLGEKWDF